MLKASNPSQTAVILAASVFTAVAVLLGWIISVPGIAFVVIAIGVAAVTAIVRLTKASRTVSRIYKEELG